MARLQTFPSARALQILRLEPRGKWKDERRHRNGVTLDLESFGVESLSPDMPFQEGIELRELAAIDRYGEGTRISTVEEAVKYHGQMVGCGLHDLVQNL